MTNTERNEKRIRAIHRLCVHADILCITKKGKMARKLEGRLLTSAIVLQQRTKEEGAVGVEEGAVGVEDERSGS